MKYDYTIVAGTCTRYLALKICNELRCSIGNLMITYFADGEFSVSYEESIRGKVVFLVQSTYSNSDNLMELLLMIDAAKRASARSIVAVIPYFGWARQNRKDKPRVSIGAKLIADMLSVAGIDRLVTMDLLTEQEHGFFNVPVDHLLGSSVFLPYIQALNLENIVIASPDIGGSKRANSYAKYLNVPLILCNKLREKANEVASMQIVGEVKDKNVIIVDDMVGSTDMITKAADVLMQAGASSVRACVSHCVLSGPADKKMLSSLLEEIIISDTIPYRGTCSKVKQISVAKLFADSINAIMKNESISKHYF